MEKHINSISIHNSMETIYKRLQAGEKDILLAKELNISVSSLYSKLYKAGYTREKEISDEIWNKFYCRFVRKEITLKDIQKQLEQLSNSKISLNSIKGHFDRITELHRKGLLSVV